jgi:hypothetical protein
VRECRRYRWGNGVKALRAALKANDHVVELLLSDEPPLMPETYTPTAATKRRPFASRNCGTYGTIRQDSWNGCSRSTPRGSGTALNTSGNRSERKKSRRVSDNGGAPR